MRLLLDTHALLWWLDDRPQLGRAARDAIASENNVVFASSLAAAEISIKASLGKLKAPDDLEDQIAANAFVPLPLSVRHALRLGQLPLHHRDPFDRLLIAQAQEEGLTILSGDRHFAAYDVQVLDARA